MAVTSIGPATGSTVAARGGTTKKNVVEKSTPAKKAAPDPSGALTTALERFGITYPNAPRPSAALLAFVNGLGMNLGNAEDAKRVGIQHVNRRTTDARQDLARSAERGKENVTADLLRRGIHSSGEANTRYQRQAEDVASKEATIGRSKAEATTAIENAYQATLGAGRTTALDRVLGEETSQAQSDAISAAQEKSWKRQEEAALAADKKQSEAQRKADARWEQYYKTGSF